MVIQHKCSALRRDTRTTKLDSEGCIYVKKRPSASEGLSGGISEAEDKKKKAEVIELYFN